LPSAHTVLAGKRESGLLSVSLGRVIHISSLGIACPMKLRGSGLPEAVSSLIFSSTLSLPFR
jgi:hypothetical protein